MDSTMFDGVVKGLAQSGSRRRVVRALVAGAGLAIGARVTAQAAPGIKPIRCFKRGESCSAEGPPCCGGKRSTCHLGTCVRVEILH